MREVFEHTADLGIRARSEDLEHLFAEAAKALFSVIVANADQVKPSIERKYRIEGDQLEFLFFDWLNELLYAFESERLIFWEFEVEMDDLGLSGVCRGEKMDPVRHVMDHEVKAITYHGLKVERQDGGWLAEVIVDI